MLCISSLVASSSSLSCPCTPFNTLCAKLRLSWAKLGKTSKNAGQVLMFYENVAGFVAAYDVL
jgi:hypothetical protein